MLANVDALGVPTATARFMGGREYAAIAGEAGACRQPDQAGLAAVLAGGRHGAAQLRAWPVPSKGRRAG